MKNHLIHRLCLPALLVCIAFSGCKKGGGGSSGKDAKVTGSPSDAPVSLAPHWTAGKRFVMRMESAQTMEMPNFLAGRGGPQGTNNPPMENDFAQEYSLTVTNAADGNRGMEIEILSIELQVSRGDQQQINYDSRNKVVRDGGPMTEVFDRLIGGKVNLLVSPENKVLKVDGLKELFERTDSSADAAGNPAAGPGRGAMRGAAGLMRGVYSEEIFKQMIELAGAPRAAVRVGEQWNNSREVAAPMMGRILVTTTNTFRGWQEHEGQKCARVDFTGTMSAGGAATTNSPAPMGMTVKDGTISGHYWYSPENGIPVETSIDQTYTMGMSGPFGRPGAAAGGDSNAMPTLSIPVRQNVLFKLIEIKAAAQ